MPNFSFSSSVEEYIKANELHVNLILKTESKELSEAINTINKSKDFYKELIINTSSYKSDSYKQTKLDVFKMIHTEYLYKHVKDGTLLSEEEYTYSSEKSLYTKIKKEDFLGYRVTLNLYSIFTYNDNLVKEFAKFYNSVLIDSTVYKCNYEVLPSIELSKATKLKLYGNCIKQLTEDLKVIINTIGPNARVNRITNITENSDHRSYGSDLCVEAAMPKYVRAGSQPEEPIVTPDLLEELFNNNIRISLTLYADADIDLGCY